MESPFNPDEIAAQAAAGGGAGGAGIRPLMPEQHRIFFAHLPYMFAGVPDDAGWPLATILAGEPGFVQSPDPKTLRIDALPGAGDPAAALITADRDIGLLGLDLATRRRNRANGRIAAADAGGFSVAVQQSFGNCPKYIQRRAIERANGALHDFSGERLAALDADARRQIAGADTFFVASRSRLEGASGGADVSHRGGRPGFVGIEGDTLLIPDFAGNRYFNTLGNLLGEPRAGLLFLDFASGDILQLQGTTEIDWAPDPAHTIDGAQRLWRFHVARGWRRRAALRARWSFIDYAETTLGTGVWAPSPAQRYSMHRSQSSVAGLDAGVPSPRLRGEVR